MKKNIIVLLSSMALLCGCNQLPNKPIYEELTTDELEKAIRKDSAFGDFYDEAVKENIFAQFSPSQKAKYKKATWKRVYNYLNYQKDYMMWFQKDSIWSIQWKKEYSEDIARADSLIAYWKNYRDSCLSICSKYVQVKLANSHYEEYTTYEWNYYKCYDRPVTKYRLVMDFEFELKNGITKLDEIEYALEWYSTGYSKKYVCTTHSLVKNITPQNNTDSYTCHGEPKDKVTNTYVNMVIMNGDTIKAHYNEYDIPSKVRDYILNGESSYDYDDVIEEYASDNFMSCRNYCDKKEEEDLQEYDKLVYSLIQEMR